jgi:hypothetical protein
MMDAYIAETYQWLPKGAIFYLLTLLGSLLIWLAKRLAVHIHDNIMNSIKMLKEDVKESLSHINSKLDIFDTKINDIHDKLKDQVSLERYVCDTEKIWNEIHHLKERNMILETIAKLEQNR